MRAHSMMSITLRWGPLYWFLLRNGDVSRFLPLVFGRLPSATTKAVLVVVMVPPSVAVVVLRPVFVREPVLEWCCIRSGGSDCVLVARSAGTSKIEG